MFLEPGRLEWQETQEPALEGPSEVLVRPVVAANCDFDRTVVAGKAPIAGAFPIGHEFVAEVVVVGGSPSIGLYAAGMAVSLGAARVDYVDRSPERRAVAEALGARVFDRTPDLELGRYPITVDASASPSGLVLALRSTEPG